MASYVAPGIWQCNFCAQVLPEQAFSIDAWRIRNNKGPGRCQECENELSRAKTAFGSYSAANHRQAYMLAKEVCQARQWGQADYRLKLGLPPARGQRLKGYKTEQVLTEMKASDRMDCCGILKTFQEDKNKYRMRHKRYKIPVCWPPDPRTQQIMLEKARPDRTDCCGAPLEDNGEITGLYRGRHLRAGTEMCPQARRIHNRYQLQLYYRRQQKKMEAKQKQIEKQARLQNLYEQVMKDRADYVKEMDNYVSH